MPSGRRLERHTSNVMPTAYLRTNVWRRMTREEAVRLQFEVRRLPVSSWVHVSARRDERVGKTCREAAKAPRARHQRRGAAATARALGLRRFGESSIREPGLQGLVEEDVARLEIAVTNARLSIVQVHERVDGLLHDAQPLAPRQRLGLGHEPEAPEAPLALSGSWPQPVLKKTSSFEQSPRAILMPLAHSYCQSCVAVGSLQIWIGRMLEQ